MTNLNVVSGGVMEAPRHSSGAALKTYFVLLFFLALKAAGNSWMAWGMKQVPERMSMNPALYLRAMLNPFVAMGIAALILALLTRMALLSLADLSFVLPVTAIGYVIAVFIGKAFLHETVTHQRWLGTLLIFAGAVLVGSTSRNTTGTPPVGTPPGEDTK
jgi:drug/metabolite transporter (DMT)-like permease